ncbi:hypothetical protein MVEN_00582200 [Mycena venus]|uniref:SWIM-type domain-containing protein n=1 Tax=Mycena venus TaxID=2733690 RepID=A0A8H6YJM6_9AGAR|nr:hypothetical protein MVEN_00582200 [Mycena venus]
MGKGSKQDGAKGKKKKSKSKDTDGGQSSQVLRPFRVTEEKGGTLVCQCPEFRATGKVCQEILAVRLWMDFGPPQPYFAEPQDSDTKDSQEKGKKKATRGSGGKARGSGKRGQRPITDHRVEKDYSDFLERMGKGWQAFDTDDDFTDTDVEGQPPPKKKKSEHLEKPAGSQGVWLQPSFLPS